jgi:predicted Zn-dependent protease with MMP-like domain
VLDVPPWRFQRLVAEALDSVPDDLAERMDNVTVRVEDERPGEPYLLGLYEGVPLTSRGHYDFSVPDVITIFRLPILRRCRTEADVQRQVRITVVHEIAHHFGISDRRLHELGWA